MAQNTIYAALARQVTTYDEPAVLHAFFERQVALRPDHPAVECHGETLTYRELDERANWIAASLRDLNVHPGSLVALYLKKSVGLFAAMLGVLKAGAGYVPIDPNFPIGRVENIIDDSQVRVFISDGELGNALLPHISPEIVFLNSDAPSEQLQSSPPIDPIIVSP